MPSIGSRSSSGSEPSASMVGLRRCGSVRPPARAASETGSGSSDPVDSIPPSGSSIATSSSFATRRAASACPGGAGRGSRRRSDRPEQDAIGFLLRALQELGALLAGLLGASLRVDPDPVGLGARLVQHARRIGPRLRDGSPRPPRPPSRAAWSGACDSRSYGSSEASGAEARFCASAATAVLPAAASSRGAPARGSRPARRPARGSREPGRGRTRAERTRTLGGGSARRWAGTAGRYRWPWDNLPVGSGTPHLRRRHRPDATTIGREFGWGCAYVKGLSPTCRPPRPRAGAPRRTTRSRPGSARGPAAAS